MSTPETSFNPHSGIGWALGKIYRDNFKLPVPDMAELTDAEISQLQSQEPLPANQSSSLAANETEQPTTEEE